MTTLRGIIITTVLLAAQAAAPAFAFHAGGATTCARCHVMHGEREGEIVIYDGDALLTAATATDVCLTCHGGGNGVMGIDPLAPPPERGAGNFVFLIEDNLNDGADGLTHPIAGEAAGHSIVSLDQGLEPDSRWSQSPGGIFPTSSLGCTSCHDPHGNANFRMLHGAGPVQGGAFLFTEAAPVAAGLDCCASGVREAPDAHTAYREGMSRWCGNCHGDYHVSGGGAFVHPADEGLGESARDYALYDGTSRPQGGTPAMSYLPEVPFEDPSTTVDGTAGPTAGSRLTCLSCHRAHASSAPAAGRWDFRVQQLILDGRVSGSYPLPSPYPDAAQGSLCAKCHTSLPDGYDFPHQD